MKFFIICFLIFSGAIAQNEDPNDKIVTRSMLYDTMYNSFIFSQDLKGALEVIHEALILDKSKLWYERLIQVSLWDGNQKVAFETLKLVNQKFPDDTSIETKLYGLAELIGDYDTSLGILKRRVNREHNKDDIQKLIYLYNLSGKPMEMAKILENLYLTKSDPNYLTEAAQLYYNHSDLDDTIRVLEKQKNEHILDLRSAKLLSLCYFDKRNIKKSLEILKQYKGKKDLQFWKLWSDYGWFLRDFGSVRVASNEILKTVLSTKVDLDEEDEHGNAKEITTYREVDAHRALLLNEDVIEKYFPKIWGDFKKKIHLYLYLNILAKKKEFKKVIEWIDRVDPDIKSGDYQLALKLITALIELKEYKKARDLIDRFLAIYPQNSILWINRLWLSMLMEDFFNLQRDIVSLEQIFGGSQDELLVLGSAHLLLQNINKAEHYLKKIIENGSYTTRLKLFYRTLLIYQVKNYRGAMVEKKVWSELQELYKGKKPLDKEMLLNYLEIGLYYLHPKKFKELLALKKKDLTIEEYNRMLYIYNMHIQSFDGRTKAFKNLKKPELWVSLTYYLASYDYMSSQKLLDDSLDLLPMRDAVKVAKRNNQIALATTHAFENLEESKFDFLLNQQYEDLVKTYANRYKISSDYTQKDTLVIYNNNFFNRYYLGDGVEFSQNLNYTKYTKATLFKVIPSPEKSTFFDIKVLQDRGYYSFQMGYKKSFNSYLKLKSSFYRQLTNQTSFYFELAKNKDTSETEYLLIAGKKDSLNASVGFKFLNSLITSANLEYSNIYSSDDAKLATKTRIYATVSKLIRSQYPNLQLDAQLSYINYDRANGDRGVIEKIALYPNDPLVVGTNRYEGAVTFKYGDVATLQEPRKLKPYFDVTAMFNSNEDFAYRLRGGIAKKVAKNDFLNFYIKYDRNIKTAEDTENIRLEYKIYY